MKVKVEARNGEEEKRAAGAKRNVGRLVRKRGCSSRTRRRVQPTSTAIQRLFLACKAVFKGPGTVPEPADVQLLQVLLGILLREPSSLDRFERIHGTTDENGGEHFSDGTTDENGGKDHCLGWLEEIDISEDLKMDGVEYLGPQVIDRRHQF
ncbi:hypothetical protein GW17_00003726 [Ensete ventricosum]|nr:hypothetical protein GW17_00003726 [Ensete ventricosum]